MFRRILYGFALACAALPVFSIGAQTQSDALPASPSASAIELAGLYLSEDVRAFGAQQYAINFRSSFEADPSGLRMEKQYPGVYQAALAAGQQALSQMYDQFLPRTREKLAVIFQGALSQAELESMIAFYRSEVGGKMLHAIADNLDMSAMRKRAVENPDSFQLKSTDVQEAIDPGFVADLSAADRMEMVKFFSSPTGRKFQRVAPTLLTVLTDETNRMLQAGAAPQQEAVTSAIVEYLAAARTQKREAK